MKASIRVAGANASQASCAGERFITTDPGPNRVFGDSGDDVEDGFDVDEADDDVGEELLHLLGGTAEHGGPRATGPDAYVYGVFTPNDPDYNDPAKVYGPQQINAETAWSKKGAR